MRTILANLTIAALALAGCSVGSSRTPEENAQDEETVAIFLSGVHQAIPNLERTADSDAALVRIGVRACQQHLGGMAMQQSAQGLAASAGGNMTQREASALIAMAYAGFCPQAFDEMDAS